MIKYKNGSLFKAKGYIAHACNAEGMWGAGLALKMKHRYPNSFKEYETWCEKYGYDLVGSYVKLQEEEDVKIICLFTSGTYGKRLPSQEIILANTKKSVEALLSSMPYGSVINSNKFNSGLFKVEWSKTESIIKSCLVKRPDVQWVVWRGNV